jgi:DNA-binding transcriptional LysR family regulator
MIMNELSIGYGEIVGNMFNDLGLRPRIKAVVDNVETIKVMVQTGLGIALIPAGSADLEAKAGLLALRATVPSRSMSIHVYRASRSLSRRKELLLTQLLAGTPAES